MHFQADSVRICWGEYSAPPDPLAGFWDLLLREGKGVGREEWERGREGNEMEREE